MRRTSALLPVLLLALCGCGSGASGGDPPVARATAANSSPALPSAAPASPGKSAPPGAADGTDLESCADGRCEVAVKRGDKIKFSAPVGVAVLRVRKVADGEVDLVGTGPGIEMGWKGGGPGKSFKMNQLKIKVIAGDGDRAVLRLARA